MSASRTLISVLHRASPSQFLRVKSTNSPPCKLLGLVAYLVDIFTRARYVQISQEHLEVDRLRYHTLANGICDTTMTVPVVLQSLRQAPLGYGYHYKPCLFVEIASKRHGVGMTHNVSWKRKSTTNIARGERCEPPRLDDALVHMSTSFSVQSIPFFLSFSMRYDSKCPAPMGSRWRVDRSARSRYLFESIAAR